MGYCIISDIQREMGQFTIDDESTPTIHQVNSYIDLICDDEIDPQLRLITELPITDTTGLKHLKSIAVYGVITKIFESLNAEVDRIQHYRSIYERLLNNIIKNPSLIVGSSGASSIAKPTSSYDSTRESPFKRGEIQW